jgi:ribosomal protein S18 acetylase RimI-like enzyme
MAHQNRPEIAAQHGATTRAAELVRGATVVDTAELIRLRAVMFEAMGIDASGNEWRDAFAAQLRNHLHNSESLAGFVIDDPTTPCRLAACGLGMIGERFPGAADPTGRVGYLASMATDPYHRRRGYASAILAALLDWFDARGVRTVELHATASGEPLYRAAGFIEPFCPALSRYAPLDPRTPAAAEEKTSP